MGDVADILGMGIARAPSQSEGESILGGAKEKDKPKGKPARKPKGMSREVFALIGEDGMPPVVVAKKPVFKDKREGVTKTRWVWTTFKNSGRKDDQHIFYHWAKQAVEYPDYAFARFNIHTPAINFSDEEYNQHLHDAEWTLEETRVLCELVEKFDRRWPVVMDRYPHEKYRKKRGIEDLQRRYYGVWQTIRLARQANQGASGPLLPLGLDETNDTFDSGYEKKRRRQLDILFKRTKDEEEEESTLREELKAIDAALKKVKKHPVQKTLVKEPVEAREFAASDPALAVNDKILADLRPQPRPGFPYLQSARLTVPSMPPKLNARMLNKVRALLDQLGVPPRPLPTKTVCDLYDDLRRDMVEMFTLQKLVKQREGQLDAIRQGEDPSQVFNRMPLGATPDLPRGGPQGGGGGPGSNKSGQKRQRPGSTGGGRQSVGSAGAMGGGFAEGGGGPAEKRRRS